MGKVVAQASMSLDGFIAKADNTIGHLFDWFDNGDVELRTINPDITFHLNQESFDHLQGWLDTIGVLVCGRTLFDFTDGWDGRHTMDVPVVVVTHEAPADWIAAHPDASLEFVTEGIEAAMARAHEIAGERTVAVAAGTIARQCLELGLLLMKSPSTSFRWSSAVAVRSSGSSPLATSRSATPPPASRRSGSSTSSTRSAAHDGTGVRAGGDVELDAIAAKHRQPHVVPRREVAVRRLHQLQRPIRSPRLPRASRRAVRPSSPSGRSTRRSPTSGGQRHLLSRIRPAFARSQRLRRHC